MPGLKKTLQSAAALLVGCSCAASAEEHVWIIGGGPNVENGGVQIEYNVKWVIDVLRNAKTDSELHIYFGAGESDVSDIVEWSDPEGTAAAMQPLARVFGQQIQNGENYRPNQVSGMAKSTSREFLRDSLESEFSALQDGDRALIIYNGHGLQDEQDAGGNTIRVWDDTRVTAREFESLLAKFRPQVPVRFLFTQCYSGGFARLVHPRGDDTLELAEGQRCGFLASSYYQESEGCSPSVKMGDYRDYTTHFFAAFSGRNQQGEVVTGNLDLDDDGQLSMYDAHLFALKSGYSRSVPRATSEVFLERWQPWYLRWTNSSPVPDNLYGRLARELAADSGLPERNNDLAQAIFERKSAIVATIGELEQEEEDNQFRINQIQRVIRKELSISWPRSRWPYTANFLLFLEQDLEDATAMIRQHPEFRNLVKLQDRQLEIDERVLDQHRQKAEIEKVQRLRKLARLVEQFENQASQEERGWYEQLKSCEASPL